MDKPIKLYLVSLYENREIINFIAYILESTGSYKVISSWHKEKHKSSYEGGINDFREIDESDIVIAFYPFGRSGTAEIAYAIGKNIKTYLVFSPEMDKTQHLPNICKLIPDKHILSYENFIQTFLKNTVEEQQIKKLALETLFKDLQEILCQEEVDALLDVIEYLKKIANKRKIKDVISFINEYLYKEVKKLENEKQNLIMDQKEINKVIKSLEPIFKELRNLDD